MSEPTRVELGGADPLMAWMLEEAARALFTDGDDPTPCPACANRDQRTGIPLARMPLDLPPDRFTWLPGPCVLIFCGHCPPGRRPLLSIYHPTHLRNEEGPPAVRLPVVGL